MPETEMWSEFNRIMKLQAERKQLEERFDQPQEWEREFLDGLIVSFRPTVFEEEIRRIKREVQLEAEGVKLCVVGFIPVDERPVSEFAHQFVQFLKEQ